jgi:hypothetical protein
MLDKPRPWEDTGSRPLRPFFEKIASAPRMEIFRKYVFCSIAYGHMADKDNEWEGEMVQGGASR